MASILVVDDSSSIRALMRATLETAAYTVVEAANGAEAIQLLVNHPESEPSVIVLNLEMPTMSGWEFARVVKSYHRLATIPLLVVSGHQPDALLEGMAAGYVQKPFGRDDLLPAVARCARRTGNDRTTR